MRYFGKCFLKIPTKKGNEASCHHHHPKVLRKKLSNDTHVIYFPKRQWDMMPSLPSESTQNLLLNDTHISCFQKRQLLMMPTGDPVTCTMWKYSKFASKWYPSCVITKKGNVTWCHQFHVKVLKICFLMIPISILPKKGNEQTCTNTFTSFHKWRGWNVEKLLSNDTHMMYPQRGNVITANMDLSPLLGGSQCGRTRW